ncbi:MAG: hypothetical protein OES18_22135, partial [Deltaproteobacteria bacterium]|nr:hypothetical protein [Deltaproteobacteria bacterium]
MLSSKSTILRLFGRVVKTGEANCALHRAPRSCAEDEGGPLGVGLQELISNHLKLLWSKAMVV